MLKSLCVLFEYSKFLHKCDLKCYLFSILVLKLDKVNPTKQINKNIILIHLFEENDPKLKFICGKNM